MKVLINTDTGWFDFLDLSSKIVKEYFKTTQNKNVYPYYFHDCSGKDFLGDNDHLDVLRRCKDDKKGDTIFLKDVGKSIHYNDYAKENNWLIRFGSEFNNSEITYFNNLILNPMNYPDSKYVRFDKNLIRLVEKFNNEKNIKIIEIDDFDYTNFKLLVENLEKLCNKHKRRYD